MKTTPANPRRRGPQPQPAVADSIDLFIQQWQRERPDLDAWPLGIIGRVARISAHLQRRSEAWLQPMGLTWESFSLLASLRRAGAPYALRPSELLRQSLLTSGAMTNRIDRVEAKGWVRRIPDATDRRAVVVTLTPTGRRLADRAIAEHFAAAGHLLETLHATERDELAQLLRTLMVALEEAESGGI